MSSNDKLLIGDQELTEFQKCNRAQSLGGKPKQDCLRFLQVIVFPDDLLSAFLIAALHVPSSTTRIKDRQIGQLVELSCNRSLPVRAIGDTAGQEDRAGGLFGYFRRYDNHYRAFVAISTIVLII